MGSSRLSSAAYRNSRIDKLEEEVYGLLGAEYKSRIDDLQKAMDALKKEVEGVMDFRRQSRIDKLETEVYGGSSTDSRIDNLPAAGLKDNPGDKAERR